MVTIFRTDPDFEFRNDYDHFREVYYKNEPFTGTLVDRVEVIEYLDGVIHGTYVCKYPSGVLETQSIFDNGELLVSTSYFEDGKIKSRTYNGSFKRWNERGILMVNNDEHYFENGRIRILYGHPSDNFGVKFFSPDGDLVYTQEKDYYTHDKSTRKVTYNDDLMRKWYYDLLYHVGEESDHSETHRLHQIWMWFWEIFDRDPHEYFQIVKRLLTHPDEKVVKGICSIIAIHKFHRYIDPENESNRKAYELIREYTAYHDGREADRETKKVNW